MKITEIYIDGFKNIRDTCLDFSKEPMIVLLAPNNYGKSNLLLGIQESFGLIRSQGTEVVDYIRNISYIDEFLGKEDKRIPFIFGVKFYKRENNKLYHYTFTIDGQEKSSKKGEVYGIRHELLEYVVVDKTDGISLSSPNKLPSGHILFSRGINSDDGYETITEDSSAVATLNSPAKKVNIRHSTKESKDVDDEDEKLYPASYYLFLHKLGNTVCDGEKEEKDDWSIALKEISGVLTSLTRENIGSIIAGENSVYNTPSSLAVEAIKLEDEEKEQRAEKPRIKGEYTFFKESFLKLFGMFKDFNFIDIGGEKYTVRFDRKEGEKDENVSTLSYGTRRTFKLLSQICLNKAPLVSIEELETGLHPALYNKLMKAFFACLDEQAYNDRNDYNIISCDKRPKGLRKNDPRLIISSHAPTLVNELDGHFKSVYIGSIKDKGVTFRVLNDRGVAELTKYIEQYNGNLGLGDFIFTFFYNSVSKDLAERKWL